MKWFQKTRSIGVKQIGPAIRLGSSIVLLMLLLRIVDPQNFVKAVSKVNLVYYCLGLSLFLFSLGLLWAWRWQLILKGVGAGVMLRHVIAANLTGSFFSNFLPTPVGGDLARMYEISRRSGIAGTHSVSTVLLDRLVGLISLALTALLALIVGYHYIAEQAVTVSVLGTFLGLTLAWWLFFNPKFLGHFRWVFSLPLVNRTEVRACRLYRSLHVFYARPRLLVYTVLVSLVAQAVEILSVVLIARSLDIHASPVYFFIFLPIIWIVTMLPFSIGGLGLREGAFAFFFGLIGVSSSEAIAMSLLVYSCLICTGGLGGLIFLQGTVLDFLRQKREKTHESLGF